VSGGSATGALDRGWETAEVADDDKQELRRSSGRRAREEARQWKCKCVSARVSSWRAQGRALGPEEGTSAREQLVATGGVRGMLGRRRRDVEGRG
jgi:hypothetical protein